MSENLASIKFLPFDNEEIDIGKSKDDVGQVHIYLYGHSYNPNTGQQFSTLVRIENYSIRVVLELPLEVNWSKETLTDLTVQLRGSTKKSGRQTNFIHGLCSPIKSLYCEGLNGYLLGKRFYLEFRVKSIDGMRKTKYNIEDHTFSVKNGEKTVDFNIRVCETEVDAFRKLSVDRGIKYSDWINCKGREVIDENEKISRFKKEYIVSWDQISPIPQEESKSWIVTPIIAAFDGEMHSENGISFPDKYNPKCEITTVSINIEPIGKPNERTKISITSTDCVAPKDLKLYIEKDEIGIIKRFCELLNEYDVDILSGHNILGFDFEYFNQRVINRWVTWPQIGSRMKQYPPHYIDASWGSGNTGKMDVKYVNFPGRIYADTLHIAKNMIRLPNYKLETIAQEYLKRGKHDVSPTELFASFDHYNLALKTLEKATKYVDEQGKPHRHLNVDRKVYRDLIREYLKSLKAMGRIIDYCNEDSALVLDIFNKLNIWTTLKQFSNTLDVRIKQVYTKGQQYKGLSQFYSLLRKHGVIFNTTDVEVRKEKYEGALNLGTKMKKVGMFINVISGDINSMYPSIILAYNLSVDTETNIEFCEQMGWKENIDYKRHHWIDSPGTDREFEYNLIFVKSHVHKGFFPLLVDNLLTERRAVKAQLKGKDEDSAEYKLLNAKQEALKVSANSIYGMLGTSKNPKVPAKHIAALVTKLGRDTLMHIVRFIQHGGDPAQQQAWPKGVVVYGDSVTGDTPVLINYNGLINYINIKDIPIKGKWKRYGEEKLIAEPVDGVLIWSDKQFTRINKIIRHKTTKIIYRIFTNGGVVDVTEDHSILRSDGTEVRPKDVNIGDSLLHHNLPQPTNTVFNTVFNNCAYTMGLFYGCGNFENRSINFYHTNPTYLNEAKSELMSIYNNITFNITDNDSIYTLNANIKINEIVNQWKSFFYTNNSKKKLPIQLLNAPEFIIKRFIEGFKHSGLNVAGDNLYINDKLSAAGIVYLLQRLGFHTLIKCVNESLDIYSIKIISEGKTSNYNNITNKINLGPCDDFVYDLETDNHHFAAGIGNLVVHNTDSVQFYFDEREKVFATPQELLDFGHDYVKSINTYIAPLKIELEKAGTIMVIGPKKYIFRLRDHAKLLVDGSLNPNYGKWGKYKYTGIEMVKRNQSEILKKLYKSVIELSMDENYRSDIADEQERQLVILQDVIDSIFSIALNTMNTKYPTLNPSSNKYPLNYFLISQAYGTENPSSPMGRLAARMADRGKPINLGERVSFCYVKWPGIKSSTKVGDRMRLPDDIEYPEELDSEYYVSLMATSIEGFLRARYINSDVYRRFLDKKGVKDVIKRLLFETGHIDTLPQGSVEEAYYQTLKGFFSNTKFHKETNCELPDDLYALYEYKDSEAYNTEAKNKKSTITRVMTKTDKLGYPLIMNMPNIISNIILADKLGILKEYTRVMVSPIIYDELYGI